MQFHFTTQPTVKIKSRNVPKRRRRIARLYWLTLALAFGLGCHAAMSPHDITAQTQAVAQVAQALANVKAATAPAPEPVVAATPEVPELAEVASVVVAKTYPRTEELTVASGDNFVSLMAKADVSTQEAHRVLVAMGKKFNARALKAGNKITVALDKKPEEAKPTVTGLRMALSSISTLEMSVNDKGDLVAKQIDEPVVKKLARAGGKIDSSLYETIVGSGMPASMVGEIIKAYSYDVDFQREIQPGNRIDVVFERMQTESGKVTGFGNIIYASLSTGGKEMRIYRYTDKDGNADYYNVKGESVRKALLRTPINGARISSGFGLRNHPILGYTKMHKGMDFAAPTGTPIYASGDGVISFVGQKGGYGNYLQIKHNNTYASAYAHLSRFATGVAPGKKVRQGQIVAYVGTTGRSTGPHLHYEILMAGNQVNPANVKFKTGNALAGKELASFKRNVETIQAQLDAMPKSSGKLAMLGDLKLSAN